MAENRAVFHQPVFEKNFLAGGDVRAGEQNISVGVHDFGRNRRLVGVSIICEQPHHKKTKKHDQRDRLNPAFGDQHGFIGGFVHNFFQCETILRDRKWYPMTSGCGRFGATSGSTVDGAKSSEGRPPVLPPAGL